MHSPYFSKLKSAVTCGVVAMTWMTMSGLARAQSLQEALATAYETNPAILSAQAKAIQAVEAYNDAVAQTRVQITGSISGSSVRTNATGSYRTSEGAEASIGFKQSLLQGSLDGIPAGVRQVLGNVSSAQATYKSQESGTLASAISAYLAVVRDRGSLEVATSGVEAAAQELEAADARLLAGEGTRTEVALAKAGLAQAQAQESLSNATLMNSEATFQQVIGREATNPSDPGFPNMPASVEIAIQTAIATHPAIIGAEIGVSVARDGVITTRAQYGVSVSATGSIGAKSGGYKETLSLGISASVPLYSSGRKEAAIASAEQAVVIAEASLTAQRASVEAQVRAAWALAEAQAENLDRLMTIANAQELVLLATQAQFNAGTSTFLAVQTAQQSFVEAQDQYIRAKADAVSSSYSLLSAMGALTTEGLGLQVQHFDTLAVLEKNKLRTYDEIFSNF
ncbi:MAG: TolC family protein [Alphaproteobacteria bacterium]